MPEYYDQLESECEKIQKENHHVIGGFRQYLKTKNLTKKTIDKHVSNAEFYINDFLLYEEPLQPKEGIHKLNYFLGFWFIKKALWASVTSINENISSLKHFYTYLHKNGEVSAELCPDSVEDENHCHVLAEEDKKISRKESHPHYPCLCWDDFFENWGFSARHYLGKKKIIAKAIVRSCSNISKGLRLGIEFIDLKEDYYNYIENLYSTKIMENY